MSPPGLERSPSSPIVRRGREIEACAKTELQLISRQETDSRGHERSSRAGEDYERMVRAMFMFGSTPEWSTGVAIRGILCSTTMSLFENFFGPD